MWRIYLLYLFIILQKIKLYAITLLHVSPNIILLLFLKLASNNISPQGALMILKIIEGKPGVGLKELNLEV